MPDRLLGGLGNGNAISDMAIQQIHPDIIDTYLVGVGSSSWPTWNSPDGSYVTYVSANVKAIAAVPMFTLYQMASNGDGNISGINDAMFMASYGAQVKLMYQKIGATGQQRWSTSNRTSGATSWPQRPAATPQGCRHA